jgi:hypothetical protein
VRGAVLRQRQRLVPVRRLPFHSLQDPLRFAAGPHADHVRPGHRQEVLERVGTFNLENVESAIKRSTRSMGTVRESLLKGRISTVDLLVPTSLYQILLILQT